MITERLARFVVETRAEDIPREARNLARMGIQDFVGVTFPGSKEPVGRIIKDYAGKMGGASVSTVIGSNLKTSPYLAALANGTMGHALDYDDMGGFGHNSAAIAPAILAVGETMGISGRDILTAYVIGFELAVSLYNPLWESHYMRGWHCTDTFGSLAAGAAVARLLSLNVDQVRRTLGIAASLAGGLRQNFGTMTKPLHAGQAAANGIQAALLAHAGLTADENIIEAQFGFAKVFGHDSEVDWEQVSRNLGKIFSITASDFKGIVFKPYPSCGCTHGGIDAALYLRENYGVRPEDITEVELGSNPFVDRVLIHHRPKTGLEAKFSLEYTVARALHSGEVKLVHFSEEAVQEAPVKRLMERMKWLDKYPMPSQQGDILGTKSVTVKLVNGKEYSCEVSVSRGFPQKPLTPDEFNAKYRDCASLVLPEDRVDRSIGMLSNLAEVKDIRELMELL
jgi:2-methylcitrate dehydratase PrpD